METLNPTALQSYHPTVLQSYSTVSEFFPSTPSSGETKGYSLSMSVQYVSSNLWVSSYTPYQQELFDIISKFHQQDHWDFKRISDWLNDNGYKTPRGYKFKQNHVWSMYTKKTKSLQRFSREWAPVITDVMVNVVDYLTVPPST